MKNPLLEKGEASPRVEQKIALLEERVKKLESIINAQSRLLKEHGTYIVHLRKTHKKTKFNNE